MLKNWKKNFNPVCLQERPDTGDINITIAMITMLIEALTTSTKVLVNRGYLDATIGFVVGPEAATQTIRECVLSDPLRAAAFCFISPLCHNSTDVSNLK